MGGGGNFEVLALNIVHLVVIDIFVNCNWFDTRWQWYRTNLHTSNT